MRPKTKNRDLPPRMLRRTRKLKSGKFWEAFYYNGRKSDGTRFEIPLGRDLNEAKRKWAQLECRDAAAETSLMRFVFDQYERDIIPTKAPRTQKDNIGSLVNLRKVFDGVVIDSITPQYVALYRDRRGAKAPVRANREVSLLSHVWNVAREWGYTAKENPVTGLRKLKERPRTFYADDEVWSAVYKVACVELQDAMDLNYLTGQRPADVLKMRFSDVKEETLGVQQNKTEKRLRIMLNADGTRTEFGKLIDRIKSRERKVKSLYLIAKPDGTPLNQWTLRTRFDDARAAAVKEAKDAGNQELADKIRAFQFRDIRPKAASEMQLAHASELLGHTEQEITKKVYQRVGQLVKPTR